MQATHPAVPAGDACRGTPWSAPDRKTTLAREIAAETPDSVYLDLENPRDAARLADPGRYLDLHAERLVILDEIQRMPDLFQVLRGQIDERRGRGRRSGQFLLLGSASDTLLRQSSESLAGRIVYEKLPGLDALEVGSGRDSLWIRGGFPDAFTARSGAASARWRLNFIRTYLERDIPQFGVRVPAETLRRFWTMLAHHQGGLLNASELARSLGVSVPAVTRYVDLLADLMLGAPSVRVFRQRREAPRQETQGLHPRQRDPALAAGPRHPRRRALASGGGERAGKGSWSRT